MDRPVTSKSRGICRYYNTQRGCFAGDGCKFLHGADDKLTPYDKAKVCKYYARGYCKRGDQCWFRHAIPKVAPDDVRIRFDAETCCICLEKPITYGLLTDCSHVFCLECIRQWRAPAGKSPDVVSSGTIKCCPLCRSPSRFVTPSTHFVPNDSAHKSEATNAYKASMARVRCKYFDETSRTGKPCCPFGTDCFYQHINADGTPYVFRHGAKHSMNVYRRHRLRGTGSPTARFAYDDPIEFLQHLFENPISNLHATLDVIRASLPALMEGFAPSNEPGNPAWDEDDEIAEISIDPLELLEDNLVMHDEAATSHSTPVDGNDPHSMPEDPELLPEYTPLPAQMSPLPESPTTLHPLPEFPPTLHPLPELPTTLHPLPTYLPSRFSTVMGTHGRQTFIIDISDDEGEEEEEEEEEESVPSALDALPANSIESSDLPLPANTPVSQPSPEQHSTTLYSVGDHAEMSHNRPQLEHDADPPFVTDGRGRVVWSSTRNGRSTTADGRASRHVRAGSTPRIARPSSSSTRLVPNTRGHVRSGQDTQSIDGKVGGGEQSSPTV